MINFYLPTHRKLRRLKSPQNTDLWSQFQAIIESEECMERVACDVGGLANDAGFDTTMAHMASVMIPNKYSKYMKQFASAKNCHKLKCGNLF